MHFVSPFYFYSHPWLPCTFLQQLSRLICRLCISTVWDLYDMQSELNFIAATAFILLTYFPWQYTQTHINPWTHTNSTLSRMCMIACCFCVSLIKSCTCATICALCVFVSISISVSGHHQLLLAVVNAVSTAFQPAWAPSTFAFLSCVMTASAALIWKNPISHSLWGERTHCSNLISGLSQSQWKP